MVTTNNITEQTIKYLAKAYRYAQNNCDKRIIEYQEERLQVLLSGGSILIPIESNLYTSFRYAILRFASFKLALPDEKNKFEMTLDVDGFMKYVKNESHLRSNLSGEMVEIKASADEEIEMIKSVMKDLDRI
jgi:hypothetical protein